MPHLTLDTARVIVDRALAVARERGFNPMAAVVLDGRGALKAAASEDGCPIVRWKIAFGKANVCIRFGAGGRKMEAVAKDRPHFLAGLESVIGEGGAVPVPGGVLIRDAEGHLLGACGMSGDTSDNDEAALVAAIQAAGLVADCG